LWKLRRPGANADCLARRGSADAHLCPLWSYGPRELRPDDSYGAADAHLCPLWSYGPRELRPDDSYGAAAHSPRPLWY